MSHKSCMLYGEQEAGEVDLTCGRLARNSDVQSRGDRRGFLERCIVAAGSAVGYRATCLAENTENLSSLGDHTARVRFGKTDLLVTRYCQGTAFRKISRTDNPAARRILDRCLDVGINFFDSAEAYGWGGSEVVLGKVIARRRDDVVICTKAAATHPPQRDLASNELRPGQPIAFTRDSLTRKADGSLKRLRTDYIDLYLLHDQDLTNTPAEEILDSMDRLVRAGKIRYWGVSNHSAEQVAKLVKASSANSDAAPIAGTEDYHHIAVAERHAGDLFNVIREAELGLLAYSPQETGILSPGRETEAGKMRQPLIRVLDRVARELGATRPQVLIAWVLANPAVTSALGGAESPEHVDDNFLGAGLALPLEALADLNAVSETYTQRRLDRIKSLRGTDATQ